jgi:ABC-type polysaccharide/polyol phosphate export permease
MPFWMFLTPVLYPPDHLTGVMRTIGEINPLTAPIEMTKVGLLGVGSVSTLSLLTSLPIIFTTFFVGVSFITRYGNALAGLRSDDDDDDLGML